MATKSPADGDPAPTRRDTRARFEQWAKNPACEANTVSAVLGVPMRTVATAEGLKASFGQSPFALARGRSFERGLLAEEGKRLLTGLVEAEVLPAGAHGVLDLRLASNGGHLRSLDEALAASQAHLRQLAGPRGGRPSQALLVGLALRLPGTVMFPEAVLILDAVAVRQEGPRPQLMVGEVKTYPDCGGYTDAGELATARAQCGVYAMALQQVLEGWGIAAGVEVAPTGFLVLTKPGTNQPSVRGGEDLRYQMARAAVGFERLRELAKGIARPSSSTQGLQMVREAPTRYGDACVAFCERASGCSTRALQAGDPAALGDDMAQWLGPVSLARALELMAGAPAKGPVEDDLLARIREAGIAP